MDAAPPARLHVVDSRPIRLVIVSRRYWPLVGDVEAVLGGLAQALRERGVQVTVLTARWQHDWPEHLDDRGVQVLRIYDPPTNFWRRLRAKRRIAHWLRTHGGQFDAVYVSGLGCETQAVAETLDATQMPVIVRPESVEELPLMWPGKWRRRRLRRVARRRGSHRRG